LVGLSASSEHARTTDDATISALVRRVEVLEAEADIRRLQARYMWLCDTPNPEYGVTGIDDRVEQILELFTEDAVWEGVGEYYDNQFGRMKGKEQLRAHFRRFWGDKQDPALMLNAHYLTTEQIQVHEDGVTAAGRWIHIQPWLYGDGTALVRSSRLYNGFARDDGQWRISRVRTENVFVAPLPTSFATDVATTSVLMKP
jgi:ketosteroid isomerase-like protein